ncbi:MAG: copper chaperone [Dehalococcoidia bacterium]|nr:copper chaperone [Dehalococcoidia bacterium]
MQLTLSSPTITCEHCIATIEHTVNAVDGGRFIHGNDALRTFAIEVDSGAVLDAVSAALEAAGYPLGAAGEANAAPPASEHAHDDASWTPSYRVTRTEAGADVNYACPCSCDAGFALDRARAAQDPESCCCGRQILVGRDAEDRLRATLESPAGYRFDVQTVEMPWGQPLPVALAVPLEGATHGASA